MNIIKAEIYFNRAILWIVLFALAEGTPPKAVYAVLSVLNVIRSIAAAMEVD